MGWLSWQAVFDTFVELRQQEVETVVSWVSGRAVGEGKEGQGKGGGEGAQGKARTSTGPAHSAMWGRAVGEARKAREGIARRESKAGRWSPGQSQDTLTPHQLGLLIRPSRPRCSKRTNILTQTAVKRGRIGSQVQLFTEVPVSNHIRIRMGEGESPQEDNLCSYMR